MVVDRYRNYVQKLFFKYTISIILFLCILVLILLSINMRLLTKEDNNRTNARISELLRREIENYKDGLNELSTNSQIIDVCRQQARTRDQLAKANRLLYEFSNSNEIRCVFALVDMDGSMVCSNLYRDNRNIFVNSFLYKNMVSKMLNTPERIFMVPSRLNYSYGQTGDLLLGRAVVDGQEPVGFLFFDLLDEELYKVTSQFNAEDVVITDQFNNLVFSIGRQSEDFMGKYTSGGSHNYKSGDIIELNGVKYQTVKNSIKDHELILYTLVSVNYQQRLFRYAVIFLVIVGLLMLVSLKPLTLLITEKNLHAIDELRKSVLEMGKGNMEYSLHPHVFKEFQELHDTFKNMVVQREDLQKRNSELIERKRAMEIKQLEEQINPHFIFNVLETLRYEILIDPQKASEMIMSFANILRYSIYYGDTIVPLKTDIEYINDFLLLQKMRYNRRLTYSIDIPNDAMECRIPKLVLQPIVENALKHGMINVECIDLRISAAIDNDILTLSVRDNGAGIEPEILERLNQDLEREDVYKEHIGLYNSHRVVRLLYGRPYGLNIESTYGKGTLVTINLPVRKEEGDA